MPSKSDHKDKKTPTEDEGGADLGTRTRKRKADVAIFLQDPDEEISAVEVSKKKQSERQPSSRIDAHMLIPTPDKDDELGSPNFSSFMHQRLVSARASPLPVLGWATGDDVWKNMVNKEQTYVSDKRYMQRHPLLQPKMRVILLDWLMEVCEVYKLHRETFYLAQDFFDRFMATQHNVVKTLLQLIGISSLFIAAKLEEIYPPKLHQFAYVTDGACTEDEILSMELIVMKALKWNLSPMTVVSWLNIYMQVAYPSDISEMLLPQYPKTIFVQIAELLDLCILDIGCLGYTYGILAASALYHFSSCELMQRVSGYKLCDIEECVKWMVPFALAIREMGSSARKHFRGIPEEDLHNIQTHINTFDLLDKAEAKRAALAVKNQASPLPIGVLTPPQSNKKLSFTSQQL
ncbi:G1/S-specific cyclin-E1 [Sphaerodactylus townsendi]|uniref:G1/S-specific cyclin-E1 n=1 Tax=Sphaerodactylus townsendi TaxID=933632 RepID=UPI0020275055|nr:G1/S-specific cyclin-E1 [Sphaerodactylus townsendi]XP_048371821.1 G1/S-specific cyclin-E1 [Sphaerodactylus townsendi]